MALKPTYRVKHRYLAVSFECEQKLKKGFEKEVFSKILEFLGEYGFSKLNLDLIEARENILIFKCARDHLEELKAAIALITELQGAKVMPVTLAVSGTLKGLERKLKSQSLGKGWKERKIS